MLEPPFMDGKGETALKPEAVAHGVVPHLCIAKILEGNYPLTYSITKLWTDTQCLRAKAVAYLDSVDGIVSHLLEQVTLKSDSHPLTHVLGCIELPGDVVA
jgi:hypothetical protein